MKLRPIKTGNLVARYLAANALLKDRNRIPADCLGLQVVAASPEKLAARDAFFAAKKAEKEKLKKDQAKLLRG